MGRGLTPEQIDIVCRRTSAGEARNVVADAIGVSRNTVCGLIFRLRKAGDPRLPAPGRGAVFALPLQRDALADAFADGAYDLYEAAADAGLSVANARLRWAEIRKQLGWQAV